MAIPTALFGKIISLLLLFQLLTVYTGLKIGSNVRVVALELPPRTSVS
jgi:hypothetical protein